MKIAFFSSEVVPFAKTGGLADVAYALPKALEKEGQEVAVFMPYYRAVKDSGEDIKKLSDCVYWCKIGKDIKVYFIAKDDFFFRKGLYGENGRDYSDNLARFSYYCRKGLETLKTVGFRPDVINVHDWEAALIPVFLKFSANKDNFYEKIKVILTIHNVGYQGIFPPEQFAALNLDRELFSVKGLEFFGNINILKAGIIFSDFINTVSPTYSREIRTSKYGFGLEGVLNERRDALCGILNGVDYSIWDPETDRFIFKNFHRKDLTGKKANKANLQRLCNLSVDEHVPLIGIVSRMAEQKGFDMLASTVEKICGMGAQFVILGQGDEKYHKCFMDLAGKNPGCISVNLKFDDSLAHRIYAGSDMFFMPSKYEPCGLGQMIALKYGSIPVVFKTGGLADSVNSNNGFLFLTYNEKDFMNTVKKAFNAYKDKDKWSRLLLNAMNSDFSWDSSAKEYLSLYEKAKKA